MRAAQATGQSGAVRWFSSNMRAEVVSAATSVISTCVASKNSCSVSLPNPRGAPSPGASSSLRSIQATNGSAEYHPPRSTKEKRWRPLGFSANWRAIQSSSFSSAKSGTNGMFSSANSRRMAL